MTNTSGELKIAIVGSGRMGLQHARVAQTYGAGARLCALVDPSQASLEIASRQFPDVATFSSLADAVTQAGIDTVHVCTPQHTHFAVASEAIRLGCHTLIEKPFTPTLDEARRIFGAANEKGLSVCAGHQLLHEPAIRQLTEQLPLLNEVVHIESYFAFAPSRGTPTGRAGLSPDDQLMDVLPHPLYLLLDVLRRAAPDDPLRIGEVRFGGSGTIHALLSRGAINASLVVTLSGRPVESTLRVVGTGGEIIADLVRGIVGQQLGPGRSAIDKIAAPYVQAFQATTRTTGVVLRRVLRRQRDYPSLTGLIMQWYESIRDSSVARPTPEDEVLDVVRAFESIVRETGLGEVPAAAQPAEVASPLEKDRPLVIVTGGTGWLGAAVADELVAAGARVAVVSRRPPASWRRTPNVEFVAGDLADGISLCRHQDAACVVHCAAETAGGKDAHSLNSIQATENLLGAMREAGIRRLVHVSSLAVLSQANGRVSEESPLEPDPITAGPYTWGKAESEKLVFDAVDLETRIVRPAAIIDTRAFDPPGKLGKKVGPLFVAVGGPREVLGVVELERAARALSWIALHFEQAPRTINLLEPELPTRRELIGHLRNSNPTLTVFRLPRFAISMGGAVLVGVQRVLRPRKKPIDIRRVFARQSFDTTGTRALERLMSPDA